MSDRPRLLFIAPWFPFPRISGGRVRSTDILRGMKGGRFEITLASPAPPAAQEHREELDSVCDHFVSWRDDTNRSTWSRLRHLASTLPVAVALDRSAAARARIEQELAHGPSVVVVDFVHTAVLVPERLAVPSLVFTHNVESEIYGRNAEVATNPVTRAIWRRQEQKMQRFEKAALARFDVVVAVSERDRDAFRDRFGAGRVEVIPTGVDVDHLRFEPLRRDGDLTETGGTLVFTGSMDWAPNVAGLAWFLDHVWGRIVAESPGTRLVVVGRDAAPGLVRKAEQRGVAWEFTGLVDDVRPRIHAADLSIIPLRSGGGTRLKAYESMALGRPVVSTAIGVEGLPLADGEHYLAADTPQAFAGAVLRLLRDGGERRRLAAAARAYLAANFSVRAVGRAFEEICERVSRVAGATR